MGLGDVRSVAPHALVIVWDFPPTDTTVSRRALAATQALGARGCRVSVLAVSEPSVAGHEDGTLEQSVPPGTRIVRVVNDRPELVHRIDRWPRERADDPVGWLQDWSRRAAAMFDEPGYGHLEERLYDAGRQIAAGDPVDLVVAVCAPVVTVNAGSRLSKSLGAEFAVDAATLSDGDLLVEVERISRAMCSATAVWVPDDATARRLRQAHDHLGGIVSVVADGHPGTRDGRGSTAGGGASVIRAVCFVEDDGWDAAVEVVEGWLVLRETNPALAGATLDVRGWLPLESDALRLALHQSADRGVTFSPPPTRAELSAAHAAGDVMLVVSRGDRSPGRSADHLAARRPVVWCTAQVPEPEHPLEQAAHVVRPKRLSGSAIASAVETALAIDPESIAVLPTASGWDAAVDSLLTRRSDERES